MKGIAFDIVFQNRDEFEEDFAEVMLKNNNIVIATTVEKNYGFIESDRLGDITCQDCYTGIPRSVYKDVPWGHVNVESLHDRRVVAVDISKAPYAHLKDEKNRLIFTLPLALYRQVHREADEEFPWKSTGTLVLSPFF